MGDFLFNCFFKDLIFLNLKLKNDIKTPTQISCIFKCKIHFSQQSLRYG
jgi:hypothetical protein